MSLTVTSFMPSGNAAVTRNVETLSFPFAARPQAMSVYTRFIERGNVLISLGQPRVWSIGGTGTPMPGFYITHNGNYGTRFLPRTGVTTSSIVVVNPVVGDMVELLATLSATGVNQLTIAINGGVASIAAASAASPLPQAWAAQTLVLGQAAALGDYTHPLLILAGVQSLATMQRRAGVFSR